MPRRRPTPLSSAEAERRDQQRAEARQIARAKRANLIMSLRRWVQLSPHLPDGERGHRLAMLDRAEAALDDWHARPAEDKRCFELLVARMRAMPLADAVVDSLRQAPIGMRAVGAFLPAFHRMPACLERRIINS